ncbi:MAG TPA: hypothetical protein VIC82_04935 [Candidatus Nanopelagicales bacterium]|jgi:thiosulfate dehydrogenase [quinone] large subunit
MSTTHELTTHLPQPGAKPTTSPRSGYAPAALAALRVAIGFSFLWAALDKIFGWGFATPTAKSWINGGSPTKGFLSSSDGPLSGFYHAIAGSGVANVAFILGLLLLGGAMILGVGNRLSTFGGTLLFLMMWSVVLPPVQNPVLDEHLIQALAVLVLGACHAGESFGLGQWWNAQPLVQRFPILK